MIAAVLSKPQIFTLQQSPIPGIQDNEIIIRVEGCGICASSIPVWEGREWFNYPIKAGSPGHEGWGIIEGVGKQVQQLRKGDRVAFLSNNGYAEYDVATEASAVKLPYDLQ